MKNTIITIVILVLVALGIFFVVRSYNEKQAALKAEQDPNSMTSLKKETDKNTTDDIDQSITSIDVSGGVDAETKNNDQTIESL